MILENLDATATGPVTISVQSFTISAQVYSDSGQLLNDFTGANVIRFPADLAKVPAARRALIFRQIGMAMLAHLANFPDDR
jgi:hypothetical protein